MKARIFSLCILATPVLIFASEKGASDSEKSYIFSDERGLRLFGDYYFSAEDGEISSLFLGDKEVVPVGCVLVAIKSHYAIGKFKSEEYIVRDNNGKIYDGVIFFTVDKVGNLQFFKESVEKGFLGDKISEELIFERKVGK